MNLEVLYALDRISHCLSRKYGIIGHLENFRLRSDDPEFFFCAAHGPSARKTRNFMGAGGSFESSEMSQLAAGMEAIERYSAMHAVKKHHVRRKSFDQFKVLGEPAVGPSDFSLFRSASVGAYPEVEWKNDTEISWISATNIWTGEATWVPASLVSLSKETHILPLVARASTNGNAIYSDPRTAMYRGLLEVIERDAFMYCWWTRWPLQKIDWHVLNDVRLKPIIHGYRNHIDKIEVGLMKTDLPIYCVFARMRGQNHKLEPSVVWSGGASHDLVEAIRKALTELAMCFIAGRRRIKVTMNMKWPDNVELAMTNFDAHVSYHSIQAQSGLSDFMFSESSKSVKEVPPNLPAHNLSSLAKQMVSKGHNVYSIDLTSPDIQSLGLHVMKVVVPSLIDLNPVHWERPWNKRRLYSLGRQLGRLDGPVEMNQLNPTPHPFP